ncbi:polysaccharide pyruvyl transferase family protein [Bifidobacterium sp. MA2]|uniref:Polysaccharide pyruvyl transferase family protein n=1 Tax=Bifidobacterium santillanense TaxID=2809028 RepID=A0ABS5UQE8_9BIFI|nr:polysaccharide pyruvyl transferase family protein [Bifidobacterium santillanense]MBT1173169.1 polysaccharide pyruvyl transferase family protein [Bifidobacterium santillanense]
MSRNDKIATITFHNSYNCGSMLQALALQTVLRERFDADNEILDFSNEGQKAMYSPFWKVTGIKSLVKNALWATVYPQVKQQAVSYEAFEHKYFRLSSKTYASNKELDVTNNEYSKFITGSDQVWNIRCMDADDAYYLNFVSDANKRYAYAVSFGANNPFADDALKSHYLNLVGKFDRISVREQNARKWVTEATGREVSLCVDPTMLLSQEEWERTVHIGDAPIIPGDYIFYYCFSISQEIAAFLHQVSKKTGMPVYFFEPKEWALRCCWKNKIRLVRKYGPEAFLNYMKYAKMVFTTSFHGTAFSTIFHKNFWYIDSGHNDLSKDDRAVSFLTQLQLTQRYKTIPALLHTNLSITPDYTESDTALSQLREEAFTFIESIVND